LHGSLRLSTTRFVQKHARHIGSPTFVRSRIYLEDTQSAAEGSANRAIVANLRNDRLAARGPEAGAQAERRIRGREFVEWG
jgi:hypothetical protein